MPESGDIRTATRIAKASFDRCSAKEGFLASFYPRFFDACPDARPLFARTDFARQVKLLRNAIGLLLIAPFFDAATASEGSLLAKVAERHSRRHLGIEPRFYPPFVDCLLATVRDFDPEYSDAVAQAWRASIAAGVQYMQSRY